MASRDADEDNYSLHRRRLPGNNHSPYGSQAGADIGEVSAAEFETDPFLQDRYGTLQECLGNIKLLTNEKEKLEEERRMERKRAEIELEKQRLSHIEATKRN